METTTTDRWVRAAASTARGTTRSSSTTTPLLTILREWSGHRQRHRRQTAEAINPIGSGNTIINHGLIKAGASSAIFFENVDTSGGRNVVDNFGIIDARGGSNPTTGGEAIGSFGAVGITITNETGASIFGNLDLQQGTTSLRLKTGSVITGNLNGGGGGGTDTLNLSAAAGASRLAAGHGSTISRS